MLTLKPLRCGRAFTLTLIVVVSLACGIAQDQFDCENATAHLAECCPGFDATAIYCSSDSSGCSTTYPLLDVPDSDCIRNESCEDLVSTGVCGRIGALGGTMPTSAVPNAPLCGPNAPPFVPGECGACDGGTGGAVGGDEPGSFIACMGTADCAPGEVCCLEVNATISTICSLSPCGTAPQLCRESSDCAAGETCQTMGGGISVGGVVTVMGVCQPAGPPAPPDAALESADVAANASDASDEESEQSPPVGDR